MLSFTKKYLDAVNTFLRNHSIPVDSEVDFLKVLDVNKNVRIFHKIH